MFIGRKYLFIYRKNEKGDNNEKKKGAGFIREQKREWSPQF